MQKLQSVYLLMLSIIIAFIPLQLYSETDIEVDFAAFRYDSTQSLVEVYYAIPTFGLTCIEKPSEGYQAQIMIRLTINKDGKIWNEDAWRMEKTVTDTSDLSASGNMVDLLKYLMQPGTYDFSFYVEDLNNSDNHFTNNRKINVGLFSDENIGLSDIQLASSIKKAERDTNNIFWKNGFEIIPNPSAIYTKDSPVLYYYLESYNLDKTFQNGIYKNKAYVTATTIGDNDSKSLTQKKKAVSAGVEVGQLFIASLPSGTYNFNFEIYNIQDSLIKSTTKKFFVYNPTTEVTEKPEKEDIQSAILTSEFAGMKGKQLDKEFELTQYFTTKEQKNLYKELENDDGKRKYLYEVWKNMDPTPQTPINEYKLEYKRRIEQANENYRSYSRKGWQTDRGRVYILYGPPTDIERNPNNPTSFAHEIWHYDNIEGGVIFVFADFQEFGEYLQIHSTKRGETINQNWQQSIKK